MSLEKDIVALHESIGGSGKFPTSGFKLDPETGFAKSRQGSNTVPNPASVGADVTPAGYEKHNILGKEVNIPYFDNQKMHGRGPDDPIGKDTGDRSYYDIISSFLERMIGIEGDAEGDENTTTDPDSVSAEERKRKTKNPDNPINKGTRELEYKGYSALESVRHSEIKNTILENKGGIMKGIGSFALQTAALSALQSLLGMSDSEVQSFMGKKTMTSPRGPEELLAKTRKQKSISGGELAQEGPRSKRIKKKIKGTLESRRSKERAMKK